MAKKNQEIINEISALQTRAEELAFIAEFDSFKEAEIDALSREKETLLWPHSI